MKQHIVFLLLLAALAQASLLKTPIRDVQAPEGTCTTVVCGGEGDSCESSDRLCSRGMYCKSGKCTKFLGLGDDCGGTDATKCGATLQCDPRTLKCSKGEIGDGCEASSDCKGAATCTNQYCVSKAYAQLGQTCRLLVRTARCDPGAGLFCGLTSCLKFRTVPLDGTCSNALECQIGLTCNLVNGKCAVDPLVPIQSVKDGDPCLSPETSLVCQKGLRCTRTSAGYRCLSSGTTQNIGGTCSKDEDCGTAGVCRCDYDKGTQICWEIPLSTDALLDQYKDYDTCRNLQYQDVSGDYHMCDSLLTELNRSMAPWRQDCSDTSTVGILSGIVLLLAALLF